MVSHCESTLWWESQTECHVRQDQWVIDICVYLIDALELVSHLCGSSVGSRFVKTSEECLVPWYRLVVGALSLLPLASAY